MKKKEERLEKQMSEVKAENKNLVEPLQRAKEQLEELTRQLSNYDKDKQSLAVRSNTHVMVMRGGGGGGVCILFRHKIRENSVYCS